VKVLIIDGNNLVHRVFWVSKNQKDFNKYFHVYLFLASVKSYIQEHSPNVTFCVWDEKKVYTPNPRKELYPQYKLTRNTENAKNVHSQNSVIVGALKTLNIQSIYPQKYEADDVIAILHNIYKAKASIKIITADKDMCQLIDSKTTVYDPVRKTLFTEDNFAVTLGVTKEDFIFKKAILGDKSDNIEGVPGIGAKKLEKVLKKELVLTEDQLSIVKRNILLTDLTVSLNCTEEVEYVKQQIQQNNTYNIEAFKQLCNICKFNQILQNIHNWELVFKKT